MNLLLKHAREKNCGQWIIDKINKKFDDLDKNDKETDPHSFFNLKFEEN